MTIICPGCDGVGYRPGSLVTKRRGHAETRAFTAIECKACKGGGVQRLDDRDAVSPDPKKTWWFSRQGADGVKNGGAATGTAS